MHFPSQDDEAGQKHYDFRHSEGLKERLGDELCQNTHLEIAHTQNDEAALALSGELKELFPKADIYVDHLSLSVACHIGPGALAIAATRRLEE